MSGSSWASPREIKRKRCSTESGVMDHVLMMCTLEPMAQETGHGEGAGVYGGDVYDDDSSEEEEEEEVRPVKKRKGPPVQGKQCSVEGCGTLVHSRGLCRKHGGGTKKLCLVEGCGTLPQTRGLCRKHGGGTKKLCLVEGCGTLVHSRGLCRKHG